MSKRTEITDAVKFFGITFKKNDNRYSVLRGDTFLGIVQKESYWTTRGDHISWSARFASRWIAASCASRNEAALALMHFHESRSKSA